MIKYFAKLTQPINYNVFLFERNSDINATTSFTLEFVFYGIENESNKSKMHCQRKKDKMFKIPSDNADRCVYVVGDK